MDAIRMTGCVDEDTLERLYRAATVYVSPGCEGGPDVEGFGISLIEASSYGVPVVAGKGGGVGDAVVDGYTGMLVTPGDVAELTRSLRNLLANPALARKLGAQGRAWVSNRFGFSRVGQSFVEVIAAKLQHTHAPA
jgi:phosphatidylinositol alpha-1,6-mannosyltransferase